MALERRSFFIGIKSPSALWCSLCALRAMIISDWAFFLAVVYRDFVLVNDAEFESLREELVYFLNVQSTSNIQDPFYETTFEETLQTKSKIQMFLYIFESKNCSHLLQARLQSSLSDLNAFLDVLQEHSSEIVPAVEEFIACCHYQCKCMSFDQLVQLFGQLKDEFRAFIGGAPAQQASSTSLLLLQVKDLDSVEAVEERIHEYFDLHSSSSNFAWRCIFKAFCCANWGEREFALALLEDALTCARKEANEPILCFVSFMRWSLLEGEDAEQEKEIAKFLASFSTLVQQQPSTKRIVKFLQEQQRIIVQQRQCINVHVAKHEAGNSFAFLLALYLYFGPNGTEKARNLIPLAQTIISHLRKLPAFSEGALEDLVAQLTLNLHNEGSLEEAESLQNWFKSL